MGCRLLSLLFAITSVAWNIAYIRNTRSTDHLCGTYVGFHVGLEVGVSVGVFDGCFALG